MILGRAWALALLAVPAVLLWLRFRAARPRTAEASSLLVWRKVLLSDTPAGRPRPPLSAWLEAAGAALVVLAMADPGIPGAAPEVVRVLLDVSPSMEARGADGRTRLEAARAAVSGSGAVVHESRLVAEHLQPLRALEAGIVVVTDHRIHGLVDDPPGIFVAGVGGPGFNAGITAAFGEPVGDGRWRVVLVVEARGAGGPVQGTLRLGDRTRTLTLPQASPLVITEDVDLPPATPGGEVAAGMAPALEASLDVPGDVLDADDRVSLFRRGGAGVILDVPPGRKGDALVRALEAAGAVPHAARDEREGGLALRAREMMMGAPVASLDINIPPSAEGPDVLGARVAVTPHPLTAQVLVDPSVSLGPRSSSPDSGTVLMADSEGALLTVDTWEDLHVFPRMAAIRFGFHPGGTWVERDPSFVVLAQNLVDFVGGGRSRLEPAERAPLPGPSETREAAEGETFGDLAAALREAARPDPADRRPLAVILFLAGGVLLAGAWLAAR